jgi:hypothetical protein
MRAKKPHAPGHRHARIGRPLRTRSAQRCRNPRGLAAARRRGAGRRRTKVALGAILPGGGRRREELQDKEGRMRSVLPVALLLAIATSAQAQERRDVVAPHTLDAAAQVDQNDLREAGPRAGSTKVGIDASRIAQDERFADDAAVLQQPGTTSWWWIVAAVVVGALIVAVLVR